MEACSIYCDIWHVGIVSYLSSSALACFRSTCLENSKYKISPKIRFVDACAREGNLELLKANLHLVNLESEEIFSYAAKSGSIELLIYLRSLGIKNNVNAHVFAAAGKEDEKCVATLEYLQQEDKSIVWDERVYNAAAYHGNIKTLTYLCKQPSYNPIMNTKLCAFAVDGGQFEMLKFSISLGFPVTLSIGRRAAILGDIRTLKYLHENNLHIDRFCLSKACLNNQVETIKYLRDIGTLWCGTECESAAAKNHLELLIWLSEEGCLLSDDCFYSAVKNNNLEMVKFCLSKGIVVDKHSYYVAGKASLEILKYLKEQDGNTFNWNNMHWIPSCSSVEKMKWFNEEVQPLDTSSCLTAAISTQSMEIINYLYSLFPNIVLTEHMFLNACLAGRHKILEFLLANKVQLPHFIDIYIKRTKESLSDHINYLDRSYNYSKYTYYNHNLPCKILEVDEGLNAIKVRKRYRKTLEILDRLVVEREAKDSSETIEFFETVETVETVICVTALVIYGLYRWSSAEEA